MYASILRDIRKGNLAKADRAKLAHALRQTVSAITIGVRDAKCGEITVFVAPK